MHSHVEFNMAADPEAAKIVVETWGPKLKQLVMVPLDVTNTAEITPEVYKRMEGVKSTLGLTLCQLWKKAGANAKSAEVDGYISQPVQVHDAVASMFVWRPDIFEGRKLRVDVECDSAICSGQTVCDNYDRGMLQDKNTKNCFVAERMNVPKFWDITFESIIHASSKEKTRPVKPTKSAVKVKAKKVTAKKTKPVIKKAAQKQKQQKKATK